MWPAMDGVSLLIVKAKPGNQSIILGSPILLMTALREIAVVLIAHAATSEFSIRFYVAPSLHCRPP
jgi:hypothetical protein